MLYLMGASFELILNVKLLKVLLRHIKCLEYLSEEMLIHLTKPERCFHS